MNSRAWDRMRRDLHELVGARLDVATFCAQAGQQIARVVPSCVGAAESPTWYALDPCSLLVTGVYGPECEIDTAAQMRWEYVDDDVNKSVDVVRNPSGVQTLDEVTKGDPWLSPIYRDYMHDHDLAQEMLVALRTNDRHVWGTVRLNRPKAVAAFDESDRDFVRLAAPLLGEGIRRGLLADADCDVPSPGAPGLVVVDPLGGAVALSANAGAWLSLLPGATVGELPLPVHSAAFAALGRRDDPAVLRVRLVNGQWATLHGVRNELGLAETVSVIIGSPDLEPLSPVMAAIYGLSAREQQVVELVLRGHATQRIARRLRVSPYTVQEHLRHIFVKVGVASRGELVAALFFERGE